MWDERFIQLATLVSGWSKDPSTGVGCVIVGPDHEVRSLGFNGFPRGCSDEQSLYADRPRKHLRIVHAEANALLAAARTGTILGGCTAYVTAPCCSQCAAARTGTILGGCTAYVTAPCCSQCAAALIQAGIVEVVWPEGVELRPEWEASVVEGMLMFKEAGVIGRTVEAGNA